MEVPNAYRKIARTSFPKTKRKHHCRIAAPIFQSSFSRIRVDVSPIGSMDKVQTKGHACACPFVLDQLEKVKIQLMRRGSLHMSFEMHFSNRCFLVQ